MIVDFKNDKGSVIQEISFRFLPTQFFFHFKNRLRLQFKCRGYPSEENKKKN
jgi:hypothetical protein